MSNPIHMDNGATVDLTEGRVKVTKDDVLTRGEGVLRGWNPDIVITDAAPKEHTVIRSLLAVVESMRWRLYNLAPERCNSCRKERGKCSSQCDIEKAVREAKAVLGE